MKLPYFEIGLLNSRQTENNALNDSAAQTLTLFLFQFRADGDGGLISLFDNVCEM